MAETKLAMPDVEHFDPHLEIEGISDEDAAKVKEYFARFAATVEFGEDIEPGKGTSDFTVRCPKCGSAIYGGQGAIYQAIGMYTFQWGLVHGEGYCGGPKTLLSGEDDECGWPVCGYPRIEVSDGKVVSFPVPLAYHPEEVESRG